MRFLPSPPIFALAMLLFALPANAQYVLDMTTDPTAAGWSALDVGPGTSSTSGGVLTIDTVVDPGEATFLGYQAPAADWASATLTGEYTVEATVRLTAQPETSSASQSGLQIIIADGTQKFFFSLFTDRIELETIVDSGPFTGTTAYTMDTTDGFHTYSLAVVGNTIAVAVDGTPRLSAVNSGSTTQDYLQFGDLLYANDTISDWDLVTFTSTSIVDTETTSWSKVKGMFR